VETAWTIHHGILLIPSITRNSSLLNLSITFISVSLMRLVGCSSNSDGRSDASVIEEGITTAFAIHFNPIAFRNIRTSLS
jgi:hypothetical protein